MKDRINPKYFEDKINTDFIYKPKPSRVFELSPFSNTEIQYLKGLILADKSANDYEKQGNQAKHTLTENILKILNKLENDSI